SASKRPAARSCKNSGRRLTCRTTRRTWRRSSPTWTGSRRIREEDQHRPGPALAAKKATATIPIIFALATDPLSSGLVASLAKPAGNATGLSVVNLDLVGKRVELLREVVPDLRELAVLGNVGVADSEFELSEVIKAAETLGLNAIALEIKLSSDIVPTLEAIKVKPQALFVVGDPLTFTNREQIISWARSHRLPTMYAIREFVAAG